MVLGLQPWSVMFRFYHRDHRKTCHKYVAYISHNPFSSRAQCRDSSRDPMRSLVQKLMRKMTKIKLNNVWLQRKQKINKYELSGPQNEENKRFFLLKKRNKTPQKQADVSFTDKPLFFSVFNERLKRPFKQRSLSAAATARCVHLLLYICIWFNCCVAILASGTYDSRDTRHHMSLQRP